MFIRHEACEACGSSDAKAIYDNGSSFCFSCRKFTPSRSSPYMQSAAKDLEEPLPKQLPIDCDVCYSEAVMAWVGKYGITASELIKNNVLYSPSKNQLIFTFGENNKRPELWQARNFWTGAKQKYYTAGEKEKYYPIYPGQSNVLDGTHELDSQTCNETLIIVEDCISAIKAARATGSDAMPCLGSSISMTKLSRLGAFQPRYRRFVVWLDSNMYDKAQEIAGRLRMLGTKAHVVWTKDDPKCYSDQDIKKVLDTCKG